MKVLKSKTNWDLKVWEIASIYLQITSWWLEMDFHTSKETKNCKKKLISSWISRWVPKIARMLCQFRRLIRLRDQQWVVFLEEDGIIKGTKNWLKCSGFTQIRDLWLLRSDKSIRIESMILRYWCLNIEVLSIGKIFTSKQIKRLWLGKNLEICQQAQIILNRHHKRWNLLKDLPFLITKVKTRRLTLVERMMRKMWQSRNNYTTEQLFCSIKLIKWT